MRPAPTKRQRRKGSGTFTGSVVQNPFGEVQVQITLVGGKITNVTALQLPSHGRSGFISKMSPRSSRARRSRPRAPASTPSPGATYTSEAYAQSLQSALDQAHG